MGASCIHPGQVPIVNEEYTPAADEVAYARRVVEENAKAEAAGRGSFAIDGKMIDIPVVVRAQRLLARYDAIEKRKARVG
jgi:citrate lyase subunit beta/citryl-CoA lyase